MFTKRKYGEFIEICAFISLVSLTMTGISLLTQEWIYGSATVVDNTNDIQDSTINYGLWSGTLIRKITLTPREYDIYMTCLYNENKCIWSCHGSSETRLMEIKNLISGQKPLFNCQPILSLKNIKLSTNKTTNNINEDQFLNAGVYMSSLIFIIITFIFYSICFILAIVNCIICPTCWYLNTKGIIYLTIGALIVHAIALILFGFFYDFWIVENIGIFDTIVGEYKSIAYLGYSYWIFMFTCIFHTLIIILLRVMDIRLRDDKAETVIVVAQINDSTTVLY